MDDDSDSDYDRTKRALDIELEDRAVREVQCGSQLSRLHAWGITALLLLPSLFLWSPYLAWPLMLNEPYVEQASKRAAASSDPGSGAFAEDGDDSLPDVICQRCYSLKHAG